MHLSTYATYHCTCTALALHLLAHIPSPCWVHRRFQLHITRLSMPRTQPLAKACRHRCSTHRTDCYSTCCTCHSMLRNFRRARALAASCSIGSYSATADSPSEHITCAGAAVREQAQPTGCNQTAAAPPQLLNRHSFSIRYMVGTAHSAMYIAQRCPGFRGHCTCSDAHPSRQQHHICRCFQTRAWGVTHITRISQMCHTCNTHVSRMCHTLQATEPPTQYPVSRVG